MAIANNARNVSYGKPKYGGVAYRAPIGTPLPTTPDEPLDPAFENVGYLNEDGIGLSTDSSTASIADMGGLTVLTTVTSSSETYTLVMLETNQRAAKARFGDTNVESDELGNMTITHNGLPAEQSSWVFEILLTGNRADRIVIPSASVSEAAEINYNLSDAKGWGVTLAANADGRIGGGTAVEYIAALIDGFTILLNGEQTETLHLETGETRDVSVNVNVETGDVTVSEGITLATSDPLVLSVDGTRITAAGEGRATLTVTVGGLSRAIDVTVEKATTPVTGVTVTPDTETIENGSSTTLTAGITPSDATDKTVAWSSDDSGSLIALEPDGLTCQVTGKADSGEATVTCTTTDGSKTASATITLKARTVNVQSVSVTPETADVHNGDSAALTATIEPDDATDRTVTWTADDSDELVTLSPDGLTCQVSGKADSGTVTVTCTTTDGGKTDTATITLQPAAE